FVILGRLRLFGVFPFVEAYVALDDARRVTALYQWASRVPLETAATWLRDFFLAPAAGARNVS
ncbi:MAG: hypothetical protein ACJ78T_00620, partial [Myxococcales bacterium]